MVHELDEFAELLLRALVADVRDVGEVLQGLLLIGSFHGQIDGNQAIGCGSTALSPTCRRLILERLHLSASDAICIGGAPSKLRLL